MKKLITILILLCSLNLFSQRSYNYNSSNKKELGTAMIIGGVSLSTAMILENPHSYGTYPRNNKSYSSTYVIPPFYKQFPKNVFFVVGIGFTVTGLFTLKK